MAYERENRRRKQASLRAIISEKAAELERQRVELASLERISAEQAELIEKLSNNET